MHFIRFESRLKRYIFIFLLIGLKWIFIYITNTFIDCAGVHTKTHLSIWKKMNPICGNRIADCINWCKNLYVFFTAVSHLSWFDIWLQITTPTTILAVLYLAIRIYFTHMVGYYSTWNPIDFEAPMCYHSFAYECAFVCSTGCENVACETWTRKWTFKVAKILIWATKWRSSIVYDHEHLRTIQVATTNNVIGI